MCLQLMLLWLLGRHFFRFLLLARISGSFVHQVYWSSGGFVCTEHFAPTHRGIRSFGCLQGPSVLSPAPHKALERQGKTRQKMSFLAWEKWLDDWKGRAQAPDTEQRYDRGRAACACGVAVWVMCPGSTFDPAALSQTPPKAPRHPQL